MEITVDTSELNELTYLNLAMLVKDLTILDQMVPPDKRASERMVKVEKREGETGFNYTVQEYDHHYTRRDPEEEYTIEQMTDFTRELVATSEWNSVKFFEMRPIFYQRDIGIPEGLSFNQEGPEAPDEKIQIVLDLTERTVSVPDQPVLKLPEIISAKIDIECISAPGEFPMSMMFYQGDKYAVIISNQESKQEG